jgi:hypothetical protein
MVEALTVREDQIRPVLGIRSDEFSFKLFDLKILPANN